MREGFLQGAHRLRGAQMAQKTQDQAARDAEFPLCLRDRAAETVEHGGERDPASCVSLRIEENLRMHDSLRVRFAQVGLRERMKVINVAQHGGAVIINVEK